MVISLVKLREKSLHRVKTGGGGEQKARETSERSLSGIPVDALGNEDGLCVVDRVPLKELQHFTHWQ